MTIRGLIEAIERGEYHRECGLARYTALYEALGGPRQNIPNWGKILDAMRKPPKEAAAILRALEGGRE